MTIIDKNRKALFEFLTKTTATTATATTTTTTKLK